MSESVVELLRQAIGHMSNSVQSVQKVVVQLVDIVTALDKRITALEDQGTRPK